MQLVHSYEVVDFRPLIADEPHYGWDSVKSESLHAACDDREDLRRRGLVEPMPSVNENDTWVHRYRITVPYFSFGEGKIAETVIVFSTSQQ